LDALPKIDGSQNWEGLKTIVMVESGGVFIVNYTSNQHQFTFRIGYSIF